MTALQFGYEIFTSGINLCRMKKGKIEMLTARQFSERAGVSYPTVMKWLRAGLVPGAKLNENTPLGTYWEIPATSVGKVEKEKPGPKPKATTWLREHFTAKGPVSPIIRPEGESYVLTFAWPQDREYPFPADGKHSLEEAKKIGDELVQREYPHKCKSEGCKGWAQATGTSAVFESASSAPAGPAKKPGKKSAKK